MTDRTHPDSGRIITSGDVIAELHDRIAELEAQLEAVGAGGVQALAASAPVAPTYEEHALDLLATIFDAYENGVQCYEDPEDLTGYLGHAFQLDNETFHACADLLNRRRPLKSTQAAPVAPVAPAPQPAPSAARPVTPYTCPKCHALWLHWPAEQTGFGRDTLNCRSADHCHYCEKAGVEQLQRLEHVPAVLSAPQQSPTPQANSQPAPVLDRARIREIFMAHGFTVKEGQTDLKQYVYDAADALLRAARAQADSVLEDAARYRWLRINAIGAYRTNDGNGPVSVYHLFKIPAIPGIPEETDAAIDAARAQQKGGA